MASQSIPRPEPVYRPGMKEGGGWCPYEGCWNITKHGTVNLPLIFPEGTDLQPFIRATASGKGNNQAFWGWLHTDSELTVVLVDLACHCGPPKVTLVESGSFGGQMINGLNYGLCQRGPVGPWAHSVAISLVLESINGRDTPAGRQNSHTGCLTCGVRAGMVGRAEWKLLKQLLPRKLVTQRQYYILQGYCRN